MKREESESKAGRSPPDSPRHGNCRQRGCRSARELRHHDQTPPRRPRGRVRSRGCGTGGAGVDRKSGIPPPYPATFSTHDGPRIRSTAAVNSRSGRTFAGTSGSTGKSRGASRRSLTDVAPGLRLKSSSSAAARSTPPSRRPSFQAAPGPGRDSFVEFLGCDQCELASLPRIHRFGGVKKSLVTEQ
jgi:hypothetical protein